MSRNLAASIRTRLKQHADVARQDFNLTLTHFGLERLLYRLSISKRASKRDDARTTLQVEWNPFLKKNRLEAISLAEVVTRLRGEVQKIGVI